MKNIMFSRMILTIGALILISMITIFYISKKRITKKLRHKVYIWLIVTNIIFLVAELGVGFCYQYDASDLVCQIVLKLRYLTDTIYFSCIFFYYYFTIRDQNHDSFKYYLKNDKNIRKHVIFTIVFIVIYLLLPFSNTTKEEFTVIAGPAFFAIVFYCVFTTLETTKINILDNKNATKKDKFSISCIFSLMLVILIFQPIFNEITIMGMIGVIHMLCIYYIYENPELELIDEIKTLTLNIERANSSNSAFLTNMSQEIIAPLNSIIELSENIIESNDNDINKSKQNLQIINDSSKDLLEIVNNILDISKIENNELKLVENDYLLSNVLKKLFDTIADKVSKKNIKLLFNIDNSIPNKLYGDSDKIYQVLLDLLLNSLNYTSVGRISLDLAKDINGNQVLLKFRITDTGSGIKRENYGKVFDKFSRLDDAVSSEVVGTGLGLTITKDYIDLLGGNIRFESVYGAGTIFNVEIPQKIKDHIPLGDLNVIFSKDNSQQNLDFSNYKILIVDDNELSLNVLEKLLKKYKFQIEKTDSGKNCIYNIKSGKKYDLIILDQMMTDMNGIEIMRVLRRLIGFTIPPVIAISANVISNVESTYINEGFAAYISKPINRSELDAVIKSIFKR